VTPEKAADAWAVVIEEAFARYERVPNLKLRLSPENKFLLLNWKVWCLRYHVSPDFVLTTILDYYNKIRRRHAQFITMGLAMNSITGERAQEIIEAAVAVEFPNRENEALHASEIQARMLRQQFPSFDPALPLQDQLEAYAERIRKHQQQRESLPIKYTRPWRGNPFGHG